MISFKNKVIWNRRRVFFCVGCAVFIVHVFIYWSILITGLYRWLPNIAKTIKKCLPMGDCVPASRWADTDEADGVRLGGMIMVPVWLHELVLLPSCNNSVNIRYKVCYLYAYWNIHMYSIRNLYYNTLINKNKEVCKWRNLPRSSYFTGDRLKKLCQFSKYTLDNLEKSICSTINRCNVII